MIRIMNNKSIVLLLVLCVAFVGCANDHEHRKVGKESSEFLAVAGMLKHLRAEGAGRALADNGAPGLGGARKAALLAALQQLDEAETIELLAVDEFGPQVYRATFQINGEQNSSMLLVCPDGKKFYWAGNN